MQGKLCSAVQICNLAVNGKYKMKKNPGLLRSFLNTFNYFIGVVISYNFGSYLSVPFHILPFRHLSISSFCHFVF